MEELLVHLLFQTVKPLQILLMAPIAFIPNLLNLCQQSLMALVPLGQQSIMALVAFIPNILNLCQQSLMALVPLCQQSIMALVPLGQQSIMALVAFIPNILNLRQQSLMTPVAFLMAPVALLPQTPDFIHQPMQTIQHGQRHRHRRLRRSRRRLLLRDLCPRHLLLFRHSHANLLYPVAPST